MAFKIISRTFFNLFLSFFDGLGLHFGTFGLTFGVLGWSLGPPWGTLGPRLLKSIQKTTFWDLILGSLFGHFCIVSVHVFQLQFGSPADHIFWRFVTHFWITLAPKIDEKVVPTAIPKNTRKFDGEIMILLLFVKRSTDSKHCQNQYKTMIFASPSHAPRLPKHVKNGPTNHPKILLNW